MPGTFTPISYRTLNRLLTAAVFYADPKMEGWFLGGGTARYALECYNARETAEEGAMSAKSARAYMHATGEIPPLPSWSVPVPTATLEALVDVARHYSDPALVGSRIDGARARTAVEFARATLTPFPDGWV